MFISISSTRLFFRLLTTLNRVVDLAAMNGDPRWGINTESHFVASDLQDHHANFIANANDFVCLTA